MPKVSVVIPTYQAKDDVKKAINSVLNQTFRNYEVIVIDDGSTDSTRQVLRSYGSRIRFFGEQHKGVSAARNRGIRASKGEYIAFLDSDDTWLPSKLALQVEILDTHPEIGFIFCDVAFMANEKILNATVFKSRGKPYSGSIYKQVISKNFISTSAMIVRKKCFDRVGLFDELLQVSEDHDMWIRLARYFKADYVDKPLVVGRIRKKSLSRDEIRLQEGNIKLLKKTLKDDSSLLNDRDLLEKAFFPLIKRLGFLYLKKGENKKARAFFKKYAVLKRQELSLLMLIVLSYLPSQFILFLWITLKAMLKSRFLSSIKHKLYSSLSEYNYSWVVASDIKH